MNKALINKDDAPAYLAGQLFEYLKENPIDAIQENFQRLKSVMSCYQCALYEVETKFKVLNEQFSLSHERNPIESIKTRMKSPESIRAKLDRLGKPLNFKSLEEMHDIAGVRVICSFVDDIYMLADCLLSQDDVFLIEKRDYIEFPKENGYRSLHLIIETPIFLSNEKRMMKVEVQLRTMAMDFWANLEHKLRYKKELPEELLDKTSQDLLDCAAVSAALDKKMQDIRNVIYNEK